MKRQMDKERDNPQARYVAEGQRLITSNPFAL